MKRARRTWSLLHKSRLSVSPVTKDEFETVLSAGEDEAHRERRTHPFFLVVVGGSSGRFTTTRGRASCATRSFARPGPTLATSVLVLLFVMLVVGDAASFFLPRSVSAPLTWVAFIWLGLAFFVVVLLAATDLARARGHVDAQGTRHAAGRCRAPPAPLAHRRRARGAGRRSCWGSPGLFEGLRRVRVKRSASPCAGFARHASGYKIVQLSDIHVGPTIGRAFIEQIVAKTNALEPDMVVITGDLDRRRGRRISATRWLRSRTCGRRTASSS